MVYAPKIGRITLQMSNIGYPEPLELIPPPAASPIPTMIEDIIRERERTILGRSVFEKLVIESHRASTQSGKTFQVRGGAILTTDAYRLELSLDCKLEGKDKTIAAWGMSFWTV